MSDNTPFGFAKLVPGFDFLQNLAKGAAQNIPQLPNLSNWVAPTLNVEELDKRITELKAVHYWLEQNGKALGATIQALEVQKMTLATLEGMNMKMGEVADALRLKPAAEKPSARQAEPPAAEPATARSKKAGKAGDGAAAASGAASAVDPLQWWGSLTQQFQAIAANAMKDAAQQTAVDAARNMATGAAKEAIKAASGVARAASGMVVAPATRAVPATAGKSTAKAAAKKKPGARKAAPAKARSRN